MPPETYTPSQAAKMLDVHANTVRAWCTEYADVMSDGARSRPRLLSAGDVAILQHVHAMRSEGRPRSEVIETLRRLPANETRAPFVDVAASPLETPPETVTAPPMVTSSVDVSALFVDLAALVDARTTAAQEDVKRVDERLRRLESGRLLWIGAGVGLAIGVMLGVIVAVLLLRP